MGHFEKKFSHQYQGNFSSASEPLLSLAVVYLYIYLAMYIIYNVFSGLEEKDEDFITCACRNADEHFYKTLFWTFCSIWVTTIAAWTCCRCVDFYYYG